MSQRQQETDERPISRKQSTSSENQSNTSLQSLDVGNSFESHPPQPSVWATEHAQVLDQQQDHVSMKRQRSQQSSMQPHGIMNGVGNGNGHQNGHPKHRSRQQSNPQSIMPQHNEHPNAQPELQYAPLPHHMPQQSMPHQIAMPQQMSHQMPQHMMQQTTQPMPQAMQQQMPQGHFQHQPSMHSAYDGQNHDVRPMSHDGSYPVPYSGIVSGYPSHAAHMRRDSVQYEGSPAPEDSGHDNKPKKRNAATRANEEELQRVLFQNRDKPLNILANEVKATEGVTGGNVEKAKQLFAMQWIRKNCKKDTGSLARGDVYGRYLARCAQHRVSNLNPASFGKLVRIIFPAIVTRRLGVRGQSQYHYIDMVFSISEEEHEDLLHSISKDQSDNTRPRTSDGHGQHLHDQNIPRNTGDRTMRSASQDSMEIADFPVIEEQQQSQLAADSGASEPSLPPSSRLCCMSANTATIKIPTRGMKRQLIEALPSALPHLPGAIGTYEAMPQPDLFTQQKASTDTPVDLPDLAPYLDGIEHNEGAAKSLVLLVQCYVTDIIDALRKCRGRLFFEHHKVLNGKMTVPVSKLFNLECVAPWIRECDMRMWKSITRFLAPLVLQNVPDQVQDLLDIIATDLVPHVLGAFHDKCPAHVVVAKIEPAARFANWLKKFKHVNRSILNMNDLLKGDECRTQMWVDALRIVDPEKAVEESRPPLECFTNIQGVMKHDMRNLLKPLSEHEATTNAENEAQAPYPSWLHEMTPEVEGVLSLEALNQSSSLLDMWVSWLQCLPQTFAEHQPECMLAWHGRFWRSILHQLGTMGAPSFNYYWYVEDFATKLLGFMVETQGFIMSKADQDRADQRQAERMRQVLSTSSGLSRDKGKRKAEAVTSLISDRPLKRRGTGSSATEREEDVPAPGSLGPQQAEGEQDEPELPEMPTGDHNGTNGVFNGFQSNDPDKLPSLPDDNYNLSPVKVSKQRVESPGAGLPDDSGIGPDVDPDNLDERTKAWFNDFQTSDAVEPIED